MSNDVTMHCPDAGLLAVHLLAVDSDQALCSVLKTSSGSKLIISKWAPTNFGLFVLAPYHC